MTRGKKNQIEIVVADSGPLISLARADALEILLVFKDEVRLIVTDFVEFEVTRNRDKYPDAKRIVDFLTQNAGKVEIQETSFGKAMKSMALMRDKFDESAEFRKIMLENGTEPPPIPKNSGELSILSFANELISTPPGVPVLVLAEDDFFLHSGAAYPGNTHILSTRSFLDTLQQLGKIKSANAIWEKIQIERPTINSARVDRPAQKINTEWASAIDEKKAKRFEEKSQANDRHGKRGDLSR